MKHLISHKPLIEEWAFYQNEVRPQLTIEISNTVDRVTFNNVEIPLNDLQRNIRAWIRQYET